MQLEDFDYDLPEGLIAHYPLKKRSDSRLLVVDDNTLIHQDFNDFPTLIDANDLLIVNNTRVLAARLFAKKSSGGKVEILIERMESETTALAHVRSSRSPKPDSTLLLYSDESFSHSAGVEVRMLERKDSLFRLAFSKPILGVLDEVGHMPLPPYINREDDSADRLRYQTLFAKEAGAVAAPTAGLHFDDGLIDQLKEKGVSFVEVTLHVGAGTFQPVKVDNMKDHKMHSEWLSVGEDVCEAVNACRARGGRVIAIGTTVVRALETASLAAGKIQPFEGFTDIFIYPGFRFKAVDAMITNFHLPKSTLLMLVSAFSGHERIKAAYQEAVKEQYRFFSYGDAMFLTNKEKTSHEC